MSTKGAQRQPARQSTREATWVDRWNGIVMEAVDFAHARDKRRRLRDIARKARRVTRHGTR